MPPDVVAVFASYSHADKKFVSPLVQYLRPTGAAVFVDEQAIVPGKKWAAVITSAIEQCRVMYLFWCKHSADSREVQKEYVQAMALAKDIVPVLLDDTPLPPDLNEYQWVDLRVFGHGETVIEQRLPLEEGFARQRLDEETHGGGKGGILERAHQWYGGEFARQGWARRDDEWVRTVVVQRDIADAEFQRAVVALSAALERRLA